MAYNENVPANAAEDPSTTEPNLRGNFTSLKTVIETNHSDFNSADEGKHKFMQMPEQAAAPTTAADEGALYTKEVSGATQLFYREESNGTERQLTGALDATTNGFIILGAITIQWGVNTFTDPGGSLTETVTFPQAYSDPAFSVVVTLLGNPVSGATPKPFGATNFTASTFDAKQQNGASAVAAFDFSWIAIGPT